jgi:hypothetical protein
MDLFRRPDASEQTEQDPDFWIEEVRLLKSFSPDTAEQIREPITFQKGLNIIWAPAPPMNQRKEINFAGHAAGKTTLCRLLRYLLGEHNTAAPGVKEAIEDNFQDGWIVGKIRVSGKPWIVARPLHHATRPRARCIRSDSFDELLSNPEKGLSFDEFHNELVAATIAPLPVDLFGDGTTEITFAHVIQWLARDQDCHLTKLYFFRHPDSKSESPNLTAEAAHFLQRTLLNLADKELQEAITSCEKLEKEEKDLPTDKEYQLRREKELNQDLVDGGIKERQAPLFTELLLGSARKTTDEREDLATRNTREAISLAKGESKQLETDLSTLQEQLGGVKTNVTTAKAAEKEAKDQIDALNGKEFNLEAEKEKARKLPPSNYCRVPRPLAENCPAFCEWTVNSDNEDNKEDAIANSKRAADRYLVACQNNRKGLETEQTRIEAKISAIKKTSESIATKVEVLEKKLKELKSPYATLRTKIDDLEKVIRALAVLSKREAVLKDEVEKAKQLQEKLQQRHRDTEDKFVDEYAWTVAQIFGGEDTDTKCKFTREKITTNISYHGKDLTSAAVTALQIFCFDIAAMTFSCRGRGFHPRFLIHDSPREADMGEAPYGRIFDHIIEQATANPNFQHIITTTSNPPEEYQKLPYLRLKLDSANSAGKLFRRDL